MAGDGWQATVDTLVRTYVCTCCAKSHAWPPGTPRPDQTGLVRAHSVVPRPSLLKARVKTNDNQARTTTLAYHTLTSCIHPLYYRPEVLAAVQQCQAEFLKEEARRKRAQLSQHLLTLLTYTAITPGRSKEYWTLHYEVHTDQLPPLHATTPHAPNCLHITDKGDAGFLALRDHKTSKHYGCDHVVLSGDSPLLQHLTTHVQLYRHVLCNEDSHSFLFVVSAHGQRTLTQQ